MRRLQRLLAATAVLWCLGGMALATPARVALVTPLTSGVKLDGIPISKTRIAEEGQKLTMSESGEVRVQLLGSTKEQMIKGKTSYVISRATLERDAKVLSRGTVTVKEELGNINKAAALSARSVGTMKNDFRPVGLVLAVPPERLPEGWLVRVVTPMDQMKWETGKSPVVGIKECGQGKPVLAEVEFSEPADHLILPPEFISPDGRYEFVVTRDGSSYSREFQIRDKEELDAIAQTEAALLASVTEEDLAGQMRLAAFYDWTDQVEKMAEVLSAVVDHPDFASLSEGERQSTYTQLNWALRSSDKPGRLIP